MRPHQGEPSQSLSAKRKNAAKPRAEPALPVRKNEKCGHVKGRTHTPVRNAGKPSFGLLQAMPAAHYDSNFHYEKYLKVHYKDCYINKNSVAISCSISNAILCEFAVFSSKIKRVQVTQLHF